MSLRTIELRPAVATDDVFLRSLFDDARRGGLPTTASPFDPRVGTPYRTHLAERRARHPRAETSVVVDGGEPVGAVTLEESAGRIHLVELVVLSGRRGRGIASAVLAGLTAGGGCTAYLRADDAAARRLYERHGFAVVAEHFGYALLATEADG